MSSELVRSDTEKQQAIEAGAQQEMAQQQAQVEIRLVKDRETGTVVSYKILITIEDRGPGSDYLVCHMQQTIEAELIIVIEKPEIVTFSQCGSRVGCLRYAAVLGHSCAGTR